MKLSNILSNPPMYNLSQLLSRGNSYAKDYLGKYVQPQDGDRILDIGCGTGLMLKYLLKYFGDIKIDYVGFDMSEEYISFAKKKFKRKGQFYCNELTENSVFSLGEFDKVIAAGVIHHLDDAQATNLFKIGLNALKQGGQLATLDGCYLADRSTQSGIVRMLLDNDRGKHIRKKYEYEALVPSGFKKIISEVRHDLFMIPYTNLVMVCKKQ